MVAGTPQVAVVEQNQMTVGREPNVALETVSTRVERLQIGAECVLGPLVARTPMGNDLGTCVSAHADSLSDRGT